MPVLGPRAVRNMIHQPKPIIIGAPRSGTTLLRFMLDSHPELAIPPETGFLAVCAQLADKGDALRNEFFQAVTNYGSDTSG